MSKGGDIYDALRDIKNLMRQSSVLTSMKNNILELTDLVHENKNGIFSKKVKQTFDMLQVTDAQLTSILQEILKPHLKTWLDNNLPDIVRNIVERQIKIVIDELNKKQ